MIKKDACGPKQTPAKDSTSKTDLTHDVKMNANTTKPEIMQILNI